MSNGSTLSDQLAPVGWLSENPRFYQELASSTFHIRCLYIDDFSHQWNLRPSFTHAGESERLHLPSLQAPLAHLPRLSATCSHSALQTGSPQKNRSCPVHAGGEHRPPSSKAVKDPRHWLRWPPGPAVVTDGVAGSSTLWQHINL